MIQAFPNDLLKNALQEGELEMKGQFMLGSNYTFLVGLHYDGRELSAVYKPSRGEQPLWDFPENSLALREVAAYWVSERLGWHFVPLTILREDGPLGPGSLQQYIEYDPEYHYFNFSEEDKSKLKPVVVFDLLVNNADRKGSHVFFENDTHKIWLIDHGLCFHEENKLRTVIWDFAGEPIPEDLLQTLSRVSAEKALLNDLQKFLSPREISALKVRAKALITSGVFPEPPQGRRAFPYPPV
jgi:uncharacterized repeat protein (TIGR03843 family)